MLFNSHIFIFLFLPAAVGGFFALGRFSRNAAAAWLCLASLVFYGWWDYRYVALLLVSIGFNFMVGRRLARAAAQGRSTRLLLAAGVAANLLLLGYYKYADFFIANSNTLLGTTWTLTHVVLPIGISFFTFTQIAFLVDAARGEAKEYSLVHYGLFVSYFPHLVAGPILHHKEMMPQFGREETYRPDARLIAAGLAVFALGLAKKVVLADSFAPLAEATFTPGKEAMGAIAAWLGVLAYTLQIYFDFSGYSDMAIGLSLMVGVRLPLNFNSPYKARSIVEFWRRWHMTLSRFLRDYLYVPLGGNRKGPVRRYLNLLVTMVLGGLWHGAAWTFVAWGALHGLYLAVNHIWRGAAQRIGLVGRIAAATPGSIYFALTFLAVVAAWVFFRASSVESALQLLASMAGASGSGVDSLRAELAAQGGTIGHILAAYRAAPSLPALVQGVFFLAEVTGLGGAITGAPLIVLGLAIAWWGPNSQQLARYGSADETARLSLGYELRWQPSFGWAAAGVLLATALYQMIVAPAAAFLYFNF